MACVGGRRRTTTISIDDAFRSNSQKKRTRRFGGVLSWLSESSRDRGVHVRSLISSEKQVHRRALAGPGILFFLRAVSSALPARPLDAGNRERALDHRTPRGLARVNASYRDDDATPRSINARVIAFPRLENFTIDF